MGGTGRDDTRDEQRKIRKEEKNNKTWSRQTWIEDWVEHVVHWQAHR